MSRKIQHKRGMKADLPELAVAEIGFTVDTKEVFIGSVEGNKQLARMDDLPSSSNKDVLDKLTDDNGKLKYDGQEVGAVTSVNGQTGEVTGLALEADVADALDGKVDKEAGKQLSTEDYSLAEKEKLGSIEDQANHYVHPDSHPASMIIESELKRFVSNAQIADWDVAEQNAKDYTDAQISLIPPVDLAQIEQEIQSVGDELATHKDDDMPHQFTDAGKKYCWGFRVSNGEPQFIYEEVE